ncbi:MAG: glycosyl hydrolase family 18 protein [Flavobacteriales bacterium]
MQAQGKKVLISIGGGNGSFKLNSTADMNTFVTKVKNVISSQGLDGIDIDLERPIYLSQTNGGTISNPEPHIQRMIDGIKQLLSWYQTTYGKKMILTFVPEVAYTTGGLSSYLSSTYGVAYLPMIETLKNDIDLLMVHLQYWISGGCFKQCTVRARYCRFYCVAGRRPSTRFYL